MHLVLRLSVSFLHGLGGFGPWGSELHAGKPLPISLQVHSLQVLENIFFAEPLPVELSLPHHPLPTPLSCSYLLIVESPRTVKARFLNERVRAVLRVKY